MTIEYTEDCIETVRHCSRDHLPDHCMDFSASRDYKAYSLPSIYCHNFNLYENHGCEDAPAHSKVIENMPHFGCTAYRLLNPKY